MTPEALAAFTIAQTDALIAELSRILAEMNAPGHDHTQDASRLKSARPRILAAVYCLSVYAFDGTDFASDAQQFKTYMTSVRQELTRLHPDWKGPFTLESILQQGVGAYLRDAPNLRELVRSKPDYVFDEEIHAVEKSDDRLALLTLKAKIYILEATRIRAYEPAHAPFARVVRENLRRIADEMTGAN